MRKLLSVFIIMLFFLTGCEGREELDHINLVTLLGIDWNKDKKEYTLTMNTVRYQQTQQTKIKTREVTWIASEDGQTISDALRNLNSRSSRKIFTLSTEVILIGKQAGQFKIKEILDYFTRQRKFRDTAHVLTTNKKAHQIMKNLPEQSLDLSTKIEENIKHSDWMKSYIPELRSVYVDYTLNNKDFVTGAIFEGPPTPFKEVPREEAKDVKNSHTVNYIMGSAVYKDGELVGFFDAVDTRSFLIAIQEKPQNTKQAGAIKVNTKNPNITASVELKNIKSDMDVKLDDNINVKLEVYIQARITELKTPYKVNTRLVEQIKNMLNNKIQSQIRDMIYKTQHKYNADILGVGDRVHKYYPHYWKKNKAYWHSIYPKIKFDIKTESKIVRVGIIRNSIMEE